MEPKHIPNPVEAELSKAFARVSRHESLGHIHAEALEKIRALTASCEALSARVRDLTAPAQEGCMFCTGEFAESAEGTE